MKIQRCKLYFTELSFSELQKEKIMEKSVAEQIKQYLKDGEIPERFTSTKSNFISTASKYSLNKKNALLRNNLPVVMEDMKEKIFEAMHQHSGRTATWNRIKSR